MFLLHVIMRTHRTKFNKQLTFIITITINLYRKLFTVEFFLKINKEIREINYGNNH